jgi:hypothetical protein
VQKFFKSFGYKRTAAALIFASIGVLRGLGNTGAAGMVEQIAGLVGMTPEELHAPVSSAELIGYGVAAVGVLHPAFMFLANVWSKRAVLAAILKADQAELPAAAPPKA